MPLLMPIFNTDDNNIIIITCECSWTFYIMIRKIIMTRKWMIIIVYYCSQWVSDKKSNDYKYLVTTRRNIWKKKMFIFIFKRFDNPIYT